MLDCLLVSLPLMRLDYPPLAPAILNGVALNNGFNSKCLDLNAEFVDDLDKDTILSYSVYAEDLSDYQSCLTRKLIRWSRKKASQIVAMHPRWVCISLLAFPQQKICKILTNEIKKINPDIKIAIGGSGVASHAKDPFLDEVYKNKLIDVGVKGEGEQIIIDILLNKLDGIVKVPQLDIDQWQKIYPNYDDFDLSRYIEGKDEQPSLGITGSKGCVRRCSFCDVASLWPKYNFRTGEDVADEIILNYTKYNVTSFSFSDSLINGSLSAFKEMNEVLVQRIPNTINYRGQYICRPKKHFNEYDYDIMKSAGASLLSIGIESGSQQVRNHMRKKFSNDDIDVTATCLGERHIKQRWLLILGYPTETDDDFKQTLELIEKYSYLAKQNLLQLATRLYMNIPGAPLYSEMEFHNLEDDFYPHFWSTDENPDLDFEKRYERYCIFIDTAINCGYIDSENHPDVNGLVNNYRRIYEKFRKIKHGN